MKRLYRLISGFFALTDYTSVVARWQIKEKWEERDYLSRSVFL